MHRPALATLALSLIAGAALAAPASGDMVFLQSDWQLPGREGQVLSITGGTGKLAAVDAAAAKAGYARGDILVQGLTYESVTRFTFDGPRFAASDNRDRLGTDGLDPAFFHCIDDHRNVFFFIICRNTN